MKMEAREMRYPRKFIQRSGRSRAFGKRLDDAIDLRAVVGRSHRLHVRNLSSATVAFFAGIAEFEVLRF